MYKTEKEIFSQYKALKQTLTYMLSNAERIKCFRDKAVFKSITFIGCGSGYCLCHSGEISAKLHLNLPANAMAAGDLMINFSEYTNIIQGTLLVAPSRSGSTSEVVKAISKAKEAFYTPCISISAKKDSELSKIADLSLEIPWAFDESVCQTRTVTNLYVANLLLIAIIAEDQVMLDEIRMAIDKGEVYMEKYLGMLKDIGNDKTWDKVVVLADGELEGIASEAAIAFKEIPQMMSNYYHLLDVRHGPMVLIDDSTLVIMACSHHGVSYQQDLISDLKKKGAKVVTVSSINEELNSDFNITIPRYQKNGVSGIPFINVPQVISYYKALSRDINPDLPDGLDPWIKL